MVSMDPDLENTPATREARQRVLEDFAVLNDVRDAGLDAAVQLACIASGCKSAFIAFVDWKTNMIRFKHNVGMPASESPIIAGETFCDRSVMHKGGNVYIADTSKHPLYHKSRLVVGAPNIACYFSVGLVLDEDVGLPVGVLCAVDPKPKDLGENQKAMMDLIAQDVVRQLRLKRVIAKGQERITELYQENHALETILSNKDLVAARSSNIVQIQQTLNTQFLACLNHELRTPANIIHCSSLLLQSTSVSAEQAEYIQSIQEGVQQLQRILAKSVEHLDATSQTLRNDPIIFDVHKFIEKLFIDCRAANRLAQREMLHPIIEVVPPLFVGDSAKLSQILRYFLENSVKFTSDSGKLGVHVKLHREQLHSSDGVGNGYGAVVVDFSVFDDGVGMSSDTIALLFKNSVQHDRSTTRKYGGLGFGLATSQNLASLMNGSISVTSKQKGDQTQLQLGDHIFPYDQGSIFTLSVPLSCPADPMFIETTLAPILLSPRPTRSTSSPTPSALSSSPLRSPPSIPHLIIPSSEAKVDPPIPISPFSPPSTSPFQSYLPPPSHKSTSPPIHIAAPVATTTSGSRILVVEDNPMNAKVLKRMLEKMGYAPDCVSDGAQAVSKYTEYPDYNLVLMDLHMPVMDGLVATRNILEIAQALDRQPKVVAVTSSVSADVQQDCIACGMTGFISKPISLSALAKVLKDV